jgi:hypothetical protein
MGMESLLGLAFTPNLIKKLTGDGEVDAVKLALESAEKEKQEKEKAAKAAMMSGSPGMAPGMKRGGAVKKMAKGGSASSRADGCATKGKTKGRFV